MVIAPIAGVAAAVGRVYKAIKTSEEKQEVTR